MAKVISSLPGSTGILSRTSQLTNDGESGVSTYVELDDISTVATTGDYNNLINVPIDFTPRVHTHNISDISGTKSEFNTSLTDGDFLFVGDVLDTPDATVTTKGILKLTGDLGGTADNPTTPTAIHKIGNETKTGTLSLITPNIGAGTSGLNAITPIIVTGGNGGSNTNITGTVQAGNAANINIKSGNGGGVTSVTGTGISGNGGNITILAGNGGVATGTGTLLKGTGGNAILQGGLSYGVPGTAELKGGNSISVAGIGASVFLTAGWGNDNPIDNNLYNGSIFSGVSSAGVVRGNTVVGSVTDDRIHRFQVTGNSIFNGTVTTSGSFINLTAPATNILLADGSTITQSSITTDISGLQAQIDLKANNSDVVKLTGDQTISGQKSFSLTGKIDMQTNNGFPAISVTALGSNGQLAAQFINNSSSPYSTALMLQTSLSGGVGNRTLDVSNQSSIGTGIVSNAINGGVSISSQSGNGDSYISNITYGGTGRNYVGRNDGTETYSVDKTGNVTATQYKISALNIAPASATATGTTGEIRITAGFIYVCTATNTWVRTALATW